MDLLSRLIRSRRFLQLPELNEYPEPAGAAEEPVSAYTPRFTKTKNLTSHRLVSLADAPVRPQVAAEGTESGGGDPRAFIVRTQRSRRLQVPPQTLDVAADPGSEADDFPDFLPPPTHRLSFSIRLRRLDTTATLTISEAPPPPQVYGAVIPVPRTSFGYSIRRQSLPELNEYPQAVPTTDILPLLKPVRRRRSSGSVATITISGVIIGAPSPGPIFVDALQRAEAPPRIKGWRVRRSLPHTDEYPQVAATAEQPVTAFQLWPTYRRSFHIRAQSAPPPVERPEVEVDNPLASFPVLAIRRRETHKTHLVLPTLGDYGDPFVAPVEPYPSYLAPVQYNRHGWRKARFVPQRDLWPVARPTGLTGFAARAPIHIHDPNWVAAISDTVYLQGDIQEEVVLLTHLGDQTVYLEGEISDTIYFMTDFNLKVDP